MKFLADIIVYRTSRTKLSELDNGTVQLNNKTLNLGIKSWCTIYHGI